MNSEGDDDNLPRTKSVSKVPSFADWNFVLKLQHPKVEFIGLYVGCETIYSPVSNHRTEPRNIIRVDKGEKIYNELKVIHRKLIEISPGRWMGLAPLLNDDREIIGFTIETKFKERQGLIPGARYLFKFRSVKIINREIVFDLKIPAASDYVDDKEPNAMASANEYSDPPGPWDDINKAKESTLAWVENLKKRSAWDGINDTGSETSSRLKDLAERPAWEDPSVWENLREAGKFTAVAILCIIELLSKLLWYSGEFTLKLVQLLSQLLVVMTPVIIRFIDFLTSSVGGLYWMIYMIWRSVCDPRPLTDKPPIDNTFIRPGLQAIPRNTPNRRLAIMPRNFPAANESYRDFGRRNIPESNFQSLEGNHNPIPWYQFPVSNDPNYLTRVDVKKYKTARELKIEEKKKQKVKFNPKTFV